MSAVNAVSLSNAVVRTHLIALPLGFVAFFAAWSFNYQIFDEQWKPLYGVILALLIGVLLFGTYQRGSKSWFVFPFFFHAAGGNLPRTDYFGGGGVFGTGRATAYAICVRWCGWAC